MKIPVFFDFWLGRTAWWYSCNDHKLIRTRNSLDFIIWDFMVHKFRFANQNESLYALAISRSFTISIYYVEGVVHNMYLLAMLELYLLCWRFRRLYANAHLYLQINQSVCKCAFISTKFKSWWVYLILLHLKFYQIFHLIII
jgi:hypothetical protein